MVQALEREPQEIHNLVNNPTDASPAPGRNPYVRYEISHCLSICNHTLLLRNCFKFAFFPLISALDRQSCFTFYLHVCSILQQNDASNA